MNDTENALLRLIDQDIREHPNRLVPLTETFLADLLKLVEGVEVGLDYVLPDDAVWPSY